MLALACCAADARGGERKDYDFSRDFPDCMRELGWNSTVEDDGGVTVHVPEGQSEAYEAARDRCDELIGANDRPDLTDDQLREVYAAMVATRDCLVGLGYELPAAPSEQSFTEIKGAWTPYVDLVDDPARDHEDTLKACPQPNEESLALSE
jgi:hypothetical protein